MFGFLSFSMVYLSFFLFLFIWQSDFCFASLTVMIKMQVLLCLRNLRWKWSNIGLFTPLPFIYLFLYLFAFWVQNGALCCRMSLYWLLVKLYLTEGMFLAHLFENYSQKMTPKNTALQNGVAWSYFSLFRRRRGQISAESAELYRDQTTINGKGKQSKFNSILLGIYFTLH